MYLSSAEMSQLNTDEDSLDCKKKDAIIGIFDIILINATRNLYGAETTYKKEIYSIRSTICAWTNVILSGKRDSRRHSTMSLSENVVVAETSYQKLEVLSFCDRQMLTF